MSYNKISLYSPLVFDYIDVKKSVLTQEQYESTYGETYAPSWDTDSILVANFNGDINADDSSGLDSIIQKWGVYRQEKNSDVQVNVALLDKEILSFEDYLVATNNEYIYRIYPETDTEIGSIITSNTVETCWKNWVVLGLNPTNDENVYELDNNNVWLFNYNLESSENTQNLSKTVYNNFTKFPKISQGKKNYLTGNVKCLIGKFINSKYYDSRKIVEVWTDFVNNNGKKILKDRKGNLYEINILESSFDYADETYEQIVSLSFNWIQTGDLSTIDYKVIVVNDTGFILNEVDKINYSGIWEDGKDWTDEYRWYD